MDSPLKVLYMRLIGKRCLIYSGGRFDNVAIEPETGEHWGSVIWCEYV
jgi:hypothetical protein